MKRKLIDLDESTYLSLHKDAVESGTNLKQYIEALLNEKARCLEDNGGGYRFTLSREPSDRELSLIMKCAVEFASFRQERTRDFFFSDLHNKIKNAGIDR